MTERQQLDALAARLGPRLVRPGDPAWDAARGAWQLTADQRPEAVATPADLDELREVVLAARDAGLTVTTQPTGHGANGSLAGSILVRPSAFDEVVVDAGARTLRIGGGVQWGTALAGLAGTGLIAPAGSSAVVGASGYLLAGGHSWFSRSTGLGARRLRAVELLTADGEHRRVDDASDAELIWALRGAGGALGVVTALEIELDAAPQLAGGRLAFDPADAAAVLAAAAETGLAAPETLAVHAGFLRFPDLPMLPEEIRGRSTVQVDVVLRGDLAELESLIAPIRAAGRVVDERLTAFGIEELAKVSDEPTDPSPGSGWSSLVERLDREAFERVLAVYDRPDAAALVAVDFRVLGGAVARESGLPGVAATVDEPFVVHTLGFGPAEATGPAFAAVREALGDAVTGRTFASFLNPGEGYGGAYDAASIERLQAVKARIDPEGRFIGNRAYV